jgi:hypothetical protein
VNARFSLLFAVAMLAAGAAFIVHLALRNENVALGYTVERERALSLRLRSEINTRALELASLRTPAALEQIGLGAGMVRPEEVPVYFVGGALRPARSSGRPR